MKRFLLWLVGVVLGVGIFLGAVMGVSYAFTTEGGCPDSTAQFGTEALEPNGWCWQVPLIGGKLDKVFASPATLTVQKLGTLYTAHPAITLPDWASYTTHHPERLWQHCICGQCERLSKLFVPG